MPSMTHKSRYYPSERSWTKTPAWAFEIPLKVVETADRTSTVTLLCQDCSGENKYLVLGVPVSFLKKNLKGLYVRKDHASISLFLSAQDKDQFTDLRGDGKVGFAQYQIRN